MIAQRKKIQFNIIFKKQQCALYLIGRIDKPKRNKIKSVVQLFCRKYITQQENNILHLAFTNSFPATTPLGLYISCFLKILSVNKFTTLIQMM